MKVLVLTSEAISAAQLRGALPDGLNPEQIEVMVVAPAVQQRPIKFWLDDADDAIARAEQVYRETVGQLGDSGISAAGDTGESDPMKAIEDALATFPAERIVMFTHSQEEQGYREDLDLEEVSDRFHLPVDRAVVGGSSP